MYFILQRGVQAEHHGMRQLMLTCFRANHGAQALYERLGYQPHDSSPASDEDCRDGHDGDRTTGCALVVWPARTGAATARATR
jgi:hypothetical protein